MRLVSVGASAMFSTTVPTWIAVGSLRSPIPRSAAPIATSANWRNSAGTNQSRYSAPSRAVVASAASQRLYGPRSAKNTPPKPSPVRVDSTSA